MAEQLSFLDSIPALAPAPKVFFDGDTYNAALDKVRLSSQLTAVWKLMVDGKWRTLREIADALTIPEASASARLRDLRKERFGNYQVERQRRGEGRKGLFEYRMGGIPHCAALPSEAN